MATQNQLGSLLLASSREPSFISAIQRQVIALAIMAKALHGSSQKGGKMNATELQLFSAETCLGVFCIRMERQVSESNKRKQTMAKKAPSPQTNRTRAFVVALVAATTSKTWSLSRY